MLPTKEELRAPGRHTAGVIGAPMRSLKALMEPPLVLLVLLVLLAAAVPAICGGVAPSRALGWTSLSWAESCG
jgi:hypothetical protein